MLEAADQLFAAAVGRKIGVDEGTNSANKSRLMSRYNPWWLLYPLFAATPARPGT